MLKQTADAKETKEVKDAPCGSLHYLFISDSLPPKNLQVQFKNLVLFSKNKFINRSPADLIELGCSDLWIDISENSGREWLERYLPSNTHKVIALYSDKRSKWIDDVAPFAETTCKSSILDKIESLSFDELGEILSAGLLRIHKTPGFLSRVLSCGANLTKKK